VDLTEITGKSIKELWPTFFAFIRELLTLLKDDLKVNHLSLLSKPSKLSIINSMVMF